MTETVEASKTQTTIVDEFLTKYSVALPAHIVDFALDVRAVIAELEEALEDRVSAGI